MNILLSSKAQVDKMLFGEGIQVIFLNPDGHLWELAWNPHFWPGPKD